jgi:iron complex outermembrane receptor protein
MISFSQEKNYSALTGSAGFTFNPERLFNLKFNIGRAFRSPNVAELASDGVHPGTGRYEIGNPDLKAETSVQADAEIDFDLQFLEFRVNGYCNLIDRFIYLQNKDDEVITLDGEEYPVYRFIQGNSMLTGFEMEVDLHPWEWLHFANSLDFVYGVNRTSGDPLPYIPPLRLVSEIKATLPVRDHHIVQKPYLQAGLEYHWRQDRTDPFESPTSGYFLLNLSAGLQLRIQQQLWTLFISCQNLTNTYYVSNLNTLKDMGVYDMGRNFTVGMVVPFGIVK